MHYSIQMYALRDRRPFSVILWTNMYYFQDNTRTFWYRFYFLVWFFSSFYLRWKQSHSLKANNFTSSAKLESYINVCLCNYSITVAVIEETKTAGVFSWGENGIKKSKQKKQSNLLFLASLIYRKKLKTEKKSKNILFLFFSEIVSLIVSWKSVDRKHNRLGKKTKTENFREQIASIYALTYSIANSFIYLDNLIQTAIKRI